MRVPSVVVINALPVVGPRAGFLSCGAVATGTYVLGLAAVIYVSRSHH
jgi:hypothetical protein